MIVLSAIGRFFKKIWDWIKQTAWIQPLLIVGVIFGIIFSIPSIVNAVKQNKKEKGREEAYYHNFQYSLELTEEYEGKKTSKADVFTTKLADVLFQKSGAEDEFKNSYGDLGDKFFVTFVQTKCDKCKEAKEGFEYFQKSLNKKDTYMSDHDDEKFNMVTIFADEETEETEESKTAFVKYLSRHEDFFGEVGGNAYDTPYYYNNKISDTDLGYLENADPDNFLTPTIMLVELTNKAKDSGYDAAAVTTVMFGVSGNDKYDKARTLFNCWNHEGDFSINEKAKA